MGQKREKKAATNRSAAGNPTRNDALGKKGKLPKPTRRKRSIKTPKPGGKLVAGVVLGDIPLLGTSLP